MAGIATIFWKDGHRQMITESEKSVAVEAYRLWKGSNPIYDEARRTLRSVSLPPSWKREAGIKDDPEDWQKEAESKLYHPGIAQGSYQGLPVNDR
jgi:hypothetical protein